MRLNADLLKRSLAGTAVIIAFGLSCADKGNDPNTDITNHPPLITSSAAVTAFESIRFSYKAIAQDPDGTTPAITFDNYPSWLAAAGDTIHGTPAAGFPDTTFMVIASDGFLADTLLVAVTVVDTSEAPNHPPVITSPSAATAEENQLFTYTASAQDPDGVSPAISFTNFPAWLSAAGDIISGIPATGTPDTSFLVIASDGLLADTLEVSVTVNDGPALISYSAQIQPIFNESCALTGCHAMGMNPAGGLRLINYNSLMNGGNSGDVVVPLNPDNSILVKRIEGTIQPQMPYQGTPLPEATIQMIRDWITQGALDN